MGSYVRVRMRTGSYVHGFVCDGVVCARRRAMVKAERADGKLEGGREGDREKRRDGRKRGVGSESDDIFI
jgi:hypothetical protein